MAGTSYSGRGRKRVSTIAVFLAVLVSGSIFLPASAAQGAGNTVTDLYEQAQRSYFMLKGDQTRRTERNAWDDVVRRYHLIIDSYPNDPLIDDIVYVTGGIYLEMYRQFGDRGLLNESIKRYRTVLSDFPDSYLQQAALFSVAEIQELHLRSPEQALESYRELVNRFPRGYKTAPARERLTVLEKDLGIQTTVQAQNTTAGSSPPAEQTQLQPIGSTTAANPKPVETPMQPVAEVSAGFGTHKAAKPDSQDAKIVDIRSSFSQDTGRVVIELDREVDFLYRKLPAPNRRVYFDLRRVNLEKSPLKTRSIPINNKYLKGIRIGQNSATTARIVLDFSSFREYRVFHLPGPENHFRIVFDLYRPGKGPSFVSAGEESQPTTEKKDRPLGDGADKTSSGKYSMARQLGAKIGTIVIDPGHGGKDPGARGFRGLTEATLNLDVALRLKKVFEREYPDITVKLTREKNEFIPLDTRPAKAKVMEGDIFISLHSNAARRGKGSGIETYYLNFASDPEAMELAAKENALSSIGQAKLEDLIKKITHFNKKEESRELAMFVQNNLYQQTKSVNPATKNRGVKSAPFVVLIGTNVPSILVEIGFINHKIEGQLLLDDAYRDRIALGLFNGLKAYIESLR